MRTLAAMGLCLFLWDARLWSEPLSVGLAIEDAVVIYADSSVASPQVAALPFAHHAIALGEGDGKTNTFDRRGWTQVETAGRLKGWVPSEAMAVLDRLRRRWAATDTLYEAPDRESPIHLPRYRGGLMDVRLRQIVGDQTWLGVYEWGSKRILWTPADDYQHEDIYIAVSRRFRGSHHDVGVLPLHHERYNRELEVDPLKSLRVALRLREIVLPQDTLLSYEGVTLPSNAGAVAADLVHEAHVAIGQYEEAVEALNTIVQGEPTDLLMGNPAAPMAALDIGDIYRDHLEDPDRALESYHFIIREYPGVSIGGFEWNDWIDLRAAERILELLADSPERLGEESLRIVAASPDSAVQMIGQRGRLRSMGLSGAYRTMADSALSIVGESPTNRRIFFKSATDFTTALVSEVLTILADNAEFDLLYETASELADRFADHDAGTSALIHAARTADRTHADVDAVIRRYRAVADLSRLWVHDPWMDEYVRSFNRRIAEIQEFIPYDSKTIRPAVELRVGFEDRYPVLDTLALGTPAGILYSSRPLMDTSLRSAVALKVRLQDGRIGWVRSDETRPRERNLILDAPPSPPSAGWNMHLANAQQNPVFPGPAIERPTVTRLLPDLSTRGLRFYDVDGDLRQDLIVSLHGQVLALDGTKLDSLFSFGRAESVVLGEDRLFLKDQDSLHCYDFISGGFGWSRALDGYLGHEPVLHAGRLYDVIRTREAERPSRTIIGVDGASGKTLWSRDLGPGYSASDIQMIVNDRAVILSMDHGVHGVLAIDPVTGGVLWKREGRLASRSMSLDESRLYGHLGSSPVFGAIDLATGNLAWTFSYPLPRRRSGPRGNLIVLPDKVVTANARGGLVALTKSDGQLVWARPAIRPWAMTAVGDMLHAAHGNGAVDSLTALSLETGATRWQMPLTRRRPERIVYQSGRLLVDSGYGIAVIADSASFAEVGSREPPPARLAQNYPNPFNAETTIAYRLSRRQHVELTVYNILGQQVRRMVEEVQLPGRYQATWDGTDSHSRPVGSGVYFARLRSGNWEQSKRMVKLR